jgi:tetratricopeptide (TPR) repeat protein
MIIPTDRERNRQLRSYTWIAAGLMLVALAASVAYGSMAAPKGGRLAAAVASFLAAIGPFAIGLLTGFLFGIPKVLQESNGSGNGKPGRRTQTNTNLEQISDWLTKVLIGVGLTELTTLPGKIQDTAEYIALSINPATPSVAAAMSLILIYFAVAGFLWGYLVTRLILEPALDRLEPDPATVKRLANAKPPNHEGDSLAKGDADEMLRFPISELRTADQFLAWGRAKLDQDPLKAREALERAVEQSPRDRRAVENLSFASLYAPAPGGFERAIRAIRGFLDTPFRQGDAGDADLYAYLACAYGQQYSWERDESKQSPDALKVIRDRAVAAARRAIELDPQWKVTLRSLKNPTTSSGENDLAALKDDPELTALLRE